MAQPCGACGETTEAREDLSGRVEGNLHVTVRKSSDGRMRLELCKECRLYHCPFCKSSVYKPKGDYASVWTHVEIHRMRAFKHGEFVIYSCNLQCRGERHFHCPYCSKTVIARKHFGIHMDKCSQLQTSAKAARNIKPVAPQHTSSQMTTSSSQPAILLLNLNSPFQQIFTIGQYLTPTKPPAQPESATKQHTASPDPSSKPNSKEDQHSESTAPLSEPKSAADQHPDSPNCLVEPPNTSDPPSVSPAPPVQPSDPTNPVLKKGQVKKIKCSMCNLYLNKKNLRKHKLRKHLISDKDITAKDHLRCQCIDSHNGVYAVAKSYQNTAVPIHVLKKTSGDEQEMVCEVERCQIISDYQKKSGLPDSQCPHLRSVDFCSTHVGLEDLKPDLLTELVGMNLIGKEMKSKCLNHRDRAIQNSAPLVTLVDLGGDHSLYLSVFEPKALPCSKLGRLFVTYNIRGRLWHCSCNQGSTSCLHKCIAKWYLFQTNKDLFLLDTKHSKLITIAELMEDSLAGTSTEKSAETPYTPGDEGIKQTAMYIFSRKKLPSSLPENVARFETVTELSTHLVPAESVCQKCPDQISLTEPVLITNKARVIAISGVLEDYSTYFKKCPNCEMAYYYQEWSEGLHNYNNYTILSLELCLLLQSSIKDHIAAGGVAKALELTVGDNPVSTMEVLQAYLHFEALTNHGCPSLVMMDLYKTGIFEMAGIEIQGLPESFTDELNAEEVWDSVRQEIVTSSLTTESSTYVNTESNLKAAACSAVTASFAPSERKRLNKQRREECHKAVTRYLVKGLHPLSTVESPWFREMTRMLNPKYHLPSREELTNTLIQSWFCTEKKLIITELLQATKAALTCDWWTNISCNHFLTVTLNFVAKGQMRQKVLCTKPVYDAQTDTVVSVQISDVLKEFGVRKKVVAVTVDNVFNMDIAIEKLQFRKLKCFARILNRAAQTMYDCSTVARWASKIRAVILWIKRSSTAQKVFQEKQQLFKQRPQSLVLDIRTRWDSLYLMVESVVEHYGAIEATLQDLLNIEKTGPEMLTVDDHRKAQAFIRVVKPLYTSLLCVSADKSPTCSQIFPILKKLEAHFETHGEDTLFTSTLKGKIWGDLSSYCKDGDTWKFLQESSAMDPRFKNRIDSNEIWQQIQNAAVDVTTTRETPSPKRPRLSTLEELFEAEDSALKSSVAEDRTLSIAERVQKEIQMYRKLPAVPTSEDPVMWWWERRDTFPLLSELSSSYLCVQASSTPHERVFSSANDTISQERLHQFCPSLICNLSVPEESAWHTWHNT